MIPKYFVLQIYWKDGKVRRPLPTLSDIRNRVQKSLETLRSDHKRNLNPTPYKVVAIFITIRIIVFVCKFFILLKWIQVSVSDQLYEFTHDLWLQNAPIGELSWTNKRWIMKFPIPVYDVISLSRDRTIICTWDCWANTEKLLIAKHRVLQNTYGVINAKTLCSGRDFKEDNKEL